MVLRYRRLLELRSVRRWAGGVVADEDVFGGVAGTLPSLGTAGLELDAAHEHDEVVKYFNAATAGDEDRPSTLAS